MSRNIVFGEDVGAFFTWGESGDWMGDGRKLDRGREGKDSHFDIEP